MRAAITGANSFIGKKLTEKLIAEGWQVVQVVRHPSACPSGAQQVLMPMEEYKNLGQAVGPCDCLVMLAWDGTRGADRMDAKRQQANLDNSVAGLRSMLEVGCGRLITAGSQAEYGPIDGPVSETALCRPNTEYGKAKLAFYEKAEELCAIAGTQYKEPRFFSLYGPGDWEKTMVISTLKNMLQNRTCSFTECVQNWDYLYIDDAIEAVALLCKRNCSDGVYNFGSGDTRQLRDYVLEMAQITQTKSKLQFGTIAYPASGMVSIWPDITKLRQELGWNAKTSFAQGIRAIVHTLELSGEMVQ